MEKGQQHENTIILQEAKMPGLAGGRVGRPLRRRESRLRPNLDTNQRTIPGLGGRRLFGGWHQAGGNRGSTPRLFLG